MTTRGTLTFLFTDLVGSTDLLSRLGDDAAVAVHRRVDDLLRSTLTEHRGTEVKSLGDGLMVVFPSAVDAVAAALEMRRRVVESDLGVSLRIGMNSGEAIAAGNDFHGTPVVTAQRLCDLAGANQILASGVTRALAGSRGGFAFSPLGHHQLKGLAESIEVWVVGDDRPLAESPVRQPVAVPYPAILNGPAGGRLLGRDYVLSRLDHAWSEVMTGVRRLVFIAGEPGIGKTASAAAWSRTVYDEGALVVAGRCAPEAVIPYQPFIEILHQILADPGGLAAVAGLGSPASELCRLVPDLAGSLPARTTVQAEPGTERYLLYEAVVSALYRIAEAFPVVAVLDDLHWADAPTVSLLDHLARHPRQGRLLIIGTYREIELSRSHPLAASLVELRRSGGFERLQLRGLDQEGVRQLLETATGQDVPDDVSEAIWAETEGNPFFVEEVVANLIESRLIGRGLTWPDASELHRLEIPEGIREVIGRRLSRLPEAINRTLAAAAVIGREFDVGLLESLTETDDDSVVDQLDEAVAAHLLIEAPSALGRYAFTHALIRQTLYEELNLTRRARLHRRVAEVLEAQGGSPAELALHFTAAHEISRALPVTIAAAQAAEGVFALAEASRHYRHALELWEELEDPEGLAEIDRAELLLRAAEASHLLDGGLAESIELALEAERNIDANTDPIRAGVIAERLARYLWVAGRGLEAIEASERAIHLIPSDPPTSERAKALATSAGILMLAGHHRESEKLSLEAIDVARKTGNRPVEGHALVTLGTTEGLTGRIDQGVAHMRQGRDISLDEKALDDIFRSSANLASILDVAGRMEEAVAEGLAGAEGAAGYGLLGKYYWYNSCNAAWSMIRLGRWDEAAALLRLEEDVHAEGMSEIFLQSLRATLNVLTGRNETARRQLETLTIMIRDMVDPQFLGPIHWMAAMLEWFEGNPNQAWNLIEQGVDKIQKGEEWFYRAPLHVLGAAVAVDLANDGVEAAHFSAAAGVHLRVMRDAVLEAENADFGAQLAQAEAELSRLAGGDPDSWARAAALWDEFPQPYDAAYCRFRQGQAMIGVGRWEEGEALFDLSAQVADRLQARPLRRMIDRVRGPGPSG
ncbi:MAG TPA: AAA family ATPase [Acidimicrobiia bacterium]|nr:AAA family ATPase [Acidimicrobiia bacterium]